MTPPVGGFAPVAPGSSIALDVVYDPQGSLEGSSATLEISSNDSTASTRMVGLSAIAIGLPETSHTTVAYYPLGEVGPGLPADISGNDYNFTNTYPGNGSITTNVSEAATDNVNSTAALDVTGAGHWIETPAGGMLSALGSDRLGIELWVKTSDLGTGNAFIIGSGHNASGLGLVADSGRWVATLDGTLLGDAEITAGEWVHLAVVNNAGTVGFYVDGELNAEQENVSLGNSDLRPHFAVNSGGGTVFSGCMDELHYFTFDEGAFDPSQLLVNLTSNGPFRISAVSFDYEANRVTLTWDSRENDTYSVVWTRDLRLWESDFDDGVEADAGDSTKRSYDLPPEAAEDPAHLFIRVLKE